VAFDLKDIIEVVQTELTSYAGWFTTALRRPTYMADKALEWQAEAFVNKEFLTLLVVSAFLGATIGAVIPERPPLEDRFTVAVIVVLTWLLISCVTHLAVRLLRAHRPLGVTVQAMMQVLALAYVLSAFAGLLVAGARMVAPPFDSWLEEAADGFFSEPGATIVFSQFVVIATYLPFVLGRAHGARGLVAGAAGVSLVGASFAAILAMLLVTVGGC
jgi:hypothetical protein